MRARKSKGREIKNIPKGWKTMKLSEVVEINPKRDLKKGRSKYVSMKDLENHNKKIRGFIYREFIGGSKFQNGDVIMARITPCLENGKMAFVDILDAGEICTGSTEFIVFSERDQVSENSFVYYLLKSDVIRNNAVASMTGTSGRQRVQTDLMGIKEVLLPPLLEQKAIAKILSDLDEKIELNRQMNEILEELGQMLFKRWFVDFEFPNEKGKPYKSSGGKMVKSEFGKIPKKWKIGFLGDNILTKFVKVGIDKFSDEKIYLATADIENTSIKNAKTKITFEKRPSRANMQPKPNTVWFAKMKDSKKITFFDDYMDFELNNHILSTGFAGLETLNNSLYYVWNFINNNEFESVKNNLCNGTTMQAINNSNISKIQIIIPDNETLNKFKLIVKPFYQRIYNNFQKSEQLEEMRDSLLPKLMTGKIRVKA